MQLHHLIITTLAASAINAAAQVPAARFDMSLSDGKITETTTQRSFPVRSQLPATIIAGRDGEALRFDGYSNFVQAQLPIANLSPEALTMTLVLAAETYPMMQVDVAETTPTYATICGNLDETTKRGLALQLSSQGDLRLQVGVNYGSGYLITVDGNEKLPRGQWNRLDMVYDKASNALTLYLNGRNIGSKRVNNLAIVHNTADFYIGKDSRDVKSGPFLLNTFCGAIDDIAFHNTAVQPSAYTPSVADFNYPAARYAAQLWRPKAHGMPSGAWSNETHGLTFSGGRWHAFFQKNANGPYMSRLHWGHISSTNLHDWHDEPIAIYPSESFDIKGAWSGCVYQSEGNTYLLYTAVDNAKARIVQAQAQDENLIQWGEKRVIIDGRPAGLSDDFRDPYHFEANGQQYIIVGTSKDGIGACTLHRLHNGTWSNDGDIFFRGSNTAQHGSFWEMPNVTPLGRGKYLFTCTPLNTSAGVRTLYWVGSIDDSGHFVPDASGMQPLEMGGISRDGYGLLSPSIFQKDGKTLLLGIVPDKLPTSENFKMGWAHTYALPREVSLDANGLLHQRPYTGLTTMRTTTTVSKEQSLLGAMPLSPVKGRHLELLGEFTVANGACGFHFFKSGTQQAALSYDPATGVLSLDYTTLARVSNDKGTWSARLPRKVEVGETLKLHVFVDGSIVDIFVNDSWAFSTRIFPTDAAAIEAEAFSTADAAVKVNAWTLDAQQHAPNGIATALRDVAQQGVYDLQGRRWNDKPQHGVYIQGGKKYVHR